MYPLLGLLNGVVSTTLVLVNGTLTGAWGLYSSTVIIHLVGIVFSFMVLLCSRTLRRFPKGLPLWMWSGGFIGLFTTLFQNAAFGHIPMTGIMALCLLGQTVTSLLIDLFGFFGKEKQRLTLPSAVGVLCSFAGMALLCRGVPGSDLFAIVLALLSGVTMTLARMVNAALSERTGALEGSFVNHLVGGVFAFLVFLLWGRGEGIPAAMPPLWCYLGGTLGVLTVLLFNVIVPHMTAFRMTIVTFVGQIFSSLLVDVLSGGKGDAETLLAGLVIALGVLVSMTAKPKKKNP